MNNIKNVVLPTNLYTDVYLECICSQAGGILIVNRRNNPIGYIIYDSGSNIWRYNKTITADSSYFHKTKLEDLIVSLINYYSEEITFSYLEFK